MVYTNPVVRSDADQLFPEDPVAVFEAESVNILQGGYERLPQEPDYDPLDDPDLVNHAGDGYCPLRDEDNKMDTFYYYIKHPPQSPESTRSKNESADSMDDSVESKGESSHSKEDDAIPSRKKPFPTPIISKYMETGSEEEPNPFGPKLLMDDDKVEEVKKIMVNIDLPSSYIPAWASDVPEEQWKDFILERLHLKRSENYCEDICEDICEQIW